MPTFPVIPQITDLLGGVAQRLEVPELVEARDRLAHAIERDERRWPRLRALRFHVECLSPADPDLPHALRVAAGRYLSFRRLRAPGKGIVLPRLGRQPLPLEGEIQLLYASLWRAEDFPSPTEHPASLWAETPVERAWLRLRTQDLAQLPLYHRWLADEGRALHLPLGLLRLAAEEALFHAVEQDHQDFAHLHRLLDIHAGDPILEADPELAHHLEALRCRIVRYLRVYEDGAGPTDLAREARDVLRHDLSADPALEATLRRQMILTETSGDEAARGLAEILDRLASASELHPPHLRTRLLLDLERLTDDSAISDRHFGAPDLPTRGRDALDLGIAAWEREVEAVRSPALARLDTLLALYPAHRLRPLARAWIERQRWPKSLTQAVERDLRFAATESEAEPRQRLTRLHALIFLPLAPGECFERLVIALRLSQPESFAARRIVCDLFVVAWIYEIPIPTWDARFHGLELSVRSHEARIASRLAPYLGLPPIRLLPAETLGCRRLLRATFETGRRPA